MTTEEEAAAKKAADANAGGNGGDDDAAARQAELNHQFAERAERAAKAERQKFLDGLGLKDEAEFAAFVEAKKKADDAQKTELQKAADEAEKAKARADNLESESNAKLEAAQKRIVDGEIKLLASQEVKDKDGKVIRPAFRADALDIVLLVVNRAEIKDEDGKITGIEKALEALAKDRALLLAGGQQAQPAQPGKGSPPPPKQPANSNQPTTAKVVVGTTL